MKGFADINDIVNIIQRSHHRSGAQQFENHCVISKKRNKDVSNRRLEYCFGKCCFRVGVVELCYYFLDELLNNRLFRCCWRLEALFL